ncbi:MAG: thioredoxin family protein [Maribacter sp.]
MIKNLLFLFLIVLAGCNGEERKSPKVFFAGQIINPTDAYVVLLKGEKVIDSAKLDERNRFSFELDSITAGLHHFNHAPEYQYVYLETGDSLMARLNTIDFDESLVFSGTNSSAELNNFLLDLFLSNEKEENAILKKFYGLEPQEFAHHVDSLRAEKLENLENLISEVELSDSAEAVAKASIDYTYFNYKEEYPFAHRKHTGQNVLKNIPKDFYDYREAISFTNPHLNYLRPYYDFMQAHIKNLSFSTCASSCEIKGGHVRNQLHFNRHKLSLIDSLVQENELKDNLFRNVAFNYLLAANDTEKNIESFITDFHLRSGNNRHIKEINELYEGIQNVQPKKKIPNVLVSNMAGEKISLQDISKDGKVVFYFWTGDDRGHFKSILKRVEHLSETKKEYTFVGINIKTDDSTWRGMVDSYGLESEKQFKADDFEEITKALIIHHLNRCVITEDATIIDAFSDMYTASL